MNKDRRATAQVCIELIKECAEVGEMSEASHAALKEAIKTMQSAEYWSLRNQSKHEGKNESTDAGIRISRVALPALEAATVALSEDNYDVVVEQLYLAVTTDGTTPQTRVKKSLRRKSS